MDGSRQGNQHAGQSSDEISHFETFTRVMQGLVWEVQGWAVR